MIFATPSSLAVPTCLDTGMELKELHPPKSVARDQLFGVITFFQEESFLHKYDCIFGKYDPTPWCIPNDLFFLWNCP